MEFKIVILCSLILVLGSIAGSVIMLASKWNLIDRYELNRPVWMPPSCIYCLGFWISSGLLALLFSSEFPFDWLFCFSPFAAAAVARFLNERNTP